MHKSLSPKTEEDSEDSMVWKVGQAKNINAPFAEGVARTAAFAREKKKVNAELTP